MAVTKIQRFEDIKALLHGDPVRYETTIEDADAFIAHEMELLTRKNSAERKETDAQKANAKYRDLIWEYLLAQDSPKTCTEISKGVPALSDFNNQKIAALMRQLVEGGRASKSTVKGKSVFAAL